MHDLFLHILGPYLLVFTNAKRNPIPIFLEVFSAAVFLHLDISVETLIQGLYKANTRLNLAMYLSHAHCQVSECWGSRNVFSYDRGQCLQQICSRLQGVYIKGLEEELKDELAALDDTPNLEILIVLTTCLERRLRERWREKANFRPSFTPISLVTLSGLPVDSPELPSSPSPPAAVDQPILLGWARLTQSER